MSVIWRNLKFAVEEMALNILEISYTFIFESHRPVYKTLQQINLEIVLDCYVL